MRNNSWLRAWVASVVESRKALSRTMAIHVLDWRTCALCDRVLLKYIVNRT